MYHTRLYRAAVLLLQDDLELVQLIHLVVD